MTKSTAFAAAATALVFMLAGCAAAEPEPDGGESAVADIDRDFDINDACSLLSGTEVIAAFGVAETGSIDGIESGRNSSARPVCDWTLDGSSRATLNFVDAAEAGDHDLRLTLQRYTSVPSCFDGRPCSTPAEFLAAWGADWEQWYQERFEIPGQADPIPPDLVVSPELLGGAATVGVRGIIFLDAEYYAEVEVFRCGSAQCRAGVDNVTEALAEKFG